MKDLYNKIKNKPIYFIIFLTLITSIPLFISLGIVSLDDFPFHYTRISYIKDELQMGNIFSKMYHTSLYNFGYGSGLFYPDLFLYIPALLNLIGISLVNSYKIFIILINFFSILSMYYSVNKMTKNNNMASIASIIYALCSYRLVDVYIRCAIGEALIFIFLPLIIYGIYLIIYDDYKKIYILILGMTGLIYSHLLSSFITVILLLVLVLLNYKRFLKDKKRIIYLFISTLITLLLTSYYILPLIEQLIDRNFYIYSYPSIGILSDRAVPFYKSILELPIKNNPWIPLGIGVIFVYITYLKFKKYDKENIKRFENKLFIIGLVLLLMSTNLFPWFIFNKIPLSIQFPWRLYAFTTVLLTIVGSIVLVNKYSKKINLLKKYLIIIMLIPLLYITAQYLSRDKIYENYLGKNIQSNGLYDYLPKEIEPNKLANIINKDYNLDIDKKEDCLIVNYKIEDNKNNYIEVPYLYYLGYKAEYKNKELEVFKTNNGLVGIKTNNIKDGKIKVYYEHTNITKISFILSFVGIITLVIYIVKNNRKILDKKNNKR